ncbi:MAG TPA: flagellar hook-length control protein FliK [Povalibacter sp.]|nr:flagellar hook-length control protein FliK [Povalibacter sp.]
MSTPMQPAAPAVPTTSPTGASSATEVASGDFLLMLGQLLGAPVAQAAAPATNTATPSTDKQGDADEAAENALAVTGLPLALLANQPQELATGQAASATQGVDLLSLGTRNADTSSGIPARATELAGALLDSLHKDEGNVATPTSVAVQHPQAVETLQQARATAPVDTGAARPLQHSVGSSAWADELGTRMVMMSERGQHSASLRLSPEHLGPLEVRIAVRDDQASVWFGAAHADTRAAIEQALPRLRELFASQGLSLADAGVHHQAPREQHRSGAAATSSVPGASSDADASASPAAIRLGLVDAYA